MALLHNLQLPGFSLPQSEGAKQAVASGFWAWYETHQDHVFYRARIRGVGVTVKAKQIEVWFIHVPLRELWEAVFGNRP